MSHKHAHLAETGRHTLSFSLEPTPPFRLDLTAWAQRRSPVNTMDRWDGQTYRRALWIENWPVELAVTQAGPPSDPRLNVEAELTEEVPGMRSALTVTLERLLGLTTDLTEFFRLAESDPAFGQLVLSLRGFRPPRFPSVFETALNGIACQQVSLILGIRLLNRMTDTWGVAFPGNEARAFPRPEDLAPLEPPALRELGFSTQKATTILTLARAEAEGRVDLEGLVNLDNDAALARLREIKGIGRWTGQYVLLRGLRRMDVFPADDVGAQHSLQRTLHLTEMPDYEGVHRLIERYKPYNGLLYFCMLLDRLTQRGLIAE